VLSFDHTKWESGSRPWSLFFKKKAAREGGGFSQSKTQWHLLNPAERVQEKETLKY